MFILLLIKSDQPCLIFMFFFIFNTMIMICAAIFNICTAAFALPSSTSLKVVDQPQKDQREHEEEDYDSQHLRCHTTTKNLCYHSYGKHIHHMFSKRIDNTCASYLILLVFNTILL